MPVYRTKCVGVPVPSGNPILMKRIIVVMLTACSIVSVSCSKMGKSDPVSPPSRHYSLLRGGEDDDRHIVIHRVEGIGGSLMSDATIVYTDGDSVERGITDQNGGCVMSLPYEGSWNLSITKTGYISVNTQVMVVDSMRRTDTLYVE